MTLSPTDTLVCDTTQLAVWQSDADYNYNRELIAPEVNIFGGFRTRILAEDIYDL